MKDFHKTAMRAGSRMKARAWAHKEFFCPCCGVRMYFPNNEEKIKRNKDPEGRKAQARRMASLDHILEKSKGGSNNLDNLRIICQGCNTDRSR